MMGQVLSLLARFRLWLLALGVLLVVGLAVLLFLFPWVLDRESMPGVAGPKVDLVTEVFDNSDAAASYNEICAYCHDTNVGPDLRLTQYDAETLKAFVRNGAGAMPAFPESEVSDAEIEEIASYLASVSEAAE